MKNKFIVIILIVLNLSLVISCTEEKKEVIVNKVDISNNLLYEKCYLELDIITSVNIENIEIDFNNLEYQYHYNKTLKDQSFYLNKYYITFPLQEIVLNSVNIKYDDHQKNLDIGNYDCSLYESSINDVKATASVINNQIDIYVSNESYQEIKIDSIIPVNNTKSHKLNVSSIPEFKKTIAHGEIEKFKYGQIYMEPTYIQVSKFLKINLIINNRKEYIYVLYSQNQS